MNSQSPGVPEVPLAKIQMQHREGGGHVSQEEGDNQGWLPATSLSRWKVLSKLLHRVKNTSGVQLIENHLFVGPIIGRSVNGYQRASGSSPCPLPAMHVPIHRDGSVPLAAVPGLLTSAPGSRGHQLYVLWLMRVNWEVSSPRGSILDPGVPQKMLLCERRLLP